MNLESRHCPFSGFFAQLAVSLAVVLFLIVGKAWAQDVEVTCTSGLPTGIQAQLDSWTSQNLKDVPHSITIHGTCIEAVVVDGFTNLSLSGSQAGDGIRRKAPIPHTENGQTWWETFVALEVRRSERVSINNLTFYENGLSDANSRQTLVSISRSNVGIWGCTISGSKGTGLGIGDNSSVELVGSKIENNEGGGVGAGGDSNLNISYWTNWWQPSGTGGREDLTLIKGNGTTANGATGISASSGARVNVGYVMIKDNPGGAVSASNEGFVELGTWGEDAPTITGNGSLPYFPAVASSNGGEIWVISPTKIEDNRAAGAEVDLGGRLIVCCGPAASISHNDGLGIRAYGGGIVAFWAPALVQGNRRGGIVLNSSKASLNPEVRIKQNGDPSDPNSFGGLVLEANSSADGAFSITDNYGPGVWIKGGSHVSFSRNTSLTSNKGGGVQVEMDGIAEFNDGVSVTGNTTNKKFDLFCTAGTTVGAPKGAKPNIGKMSCPGWTQFLPLPAWALSER